MSFKAKDLAYDAREPAFLQRLKAGIAGGDTDRHERPIARPQRLKKNEDEDDGPTYVLEESGESMSKAEYEKYQAKQERGESEPPDGEGQQKANTEDEDGESGNTKSKQQPTEIGLQRKRKAGKVIAGPGEDTTKVKDGESSSDKKPKKVAKKAKTVKLSFDDD